MGFNFEGKRVLVTGGSQGLGHAIVKKFYKSGATVFALDINEQLLKDLKIEFPNVTTICADLTKWSELESVVSKCGELHHLVNNAGIFIHEPALEVTERAIDKTFDVNFKAPFNLCQIFAKNVIANSTKGATIVNISSIGDRIAARASGAYCCSKAALTIMTKCFAVELGAPEIGIRVNTIGPGPMATALYDSMPEDVKKVGAALLQRQPMPGIIDTADVANLVLYLSSPFSNMITGTFVPIDGGIVVT